MRISSLLLTGEFRDLPMELIPRCAGLYSGRDHERYYISISASLSSPSGQIRPSCASARYTKVMTVHSLGRGLHDVWWLVGT